MEKKEKRIEKKYLGDIELGTEAVVSDPCYDNSVWCMGTVTDVLPGTYKCYMSEKDTGDWGHRIAKLHAIHESEYRQGNELTGIVVGVDSGQAGIYDKAYFDTTRHDEEWYHRACDATYHRNPKEGEHALTGDVLDGKCTVSSSGYGDGSYKCLVRKNEDGKVVSITLDFCI